MRIRIKNITGHKEPYPPVPVWHGEVDQTYDRKKEQEIEGIKQHVLCLCEMHQLIIYKKHSLHEDGR